MRNLQTLIIDMKSTQIISRSQSQNVIDVNLSAIAGCYADIIQEWILRLEEAERLINLQTAIDRIPNRSMLNHYMDMESQID